MAIPARRRASDNPAVTGTITAFNTSSYGRPRTNIRRGRIHRRHSIPDSIPVVRGEKYCPWHQRTLWPCRIHRPYFAFGREAPVNTCWISLPLLYPEECLLAVAKSPQIGMTVFSLVRHEEFDVKWLQRRLIERQRPFDIADSENYVVEHLLPSKHECLLLQCFPDGGTDSPASCDDCFHLVSPVCF